MTAEELLECINRNRYLVAQHIAGEIYIANTDGKLVMTFNDKATSIFDVDWRDQSHRKVMPDIDKDRISARIIKYMMTPIQDRGVEMTKPQKRYYLFWDSDSDGTSNCLAKGVNGWSIVKFDKIAQLNRFVQKRVGPSSCEFTEDELNRIKQDAPWLTEAIESMKVPVTDSSK